ncbi:hypothetical protein [Pseudomonas sp. NCCP-436]|uniref:hypothetical protein n=1 Tax=Pseudomonas sp. NCCP-436 TaxID=2842481 RepID=UPI001C7F94CA|nr:hypothetical protein [Pseudomonas sp. NCCP-436]
MDPDVRSWADFYKALIANGLMLSLEGGDDIVRRSVDDGIPIEEATKICNVPKGSHHDGKQVSSERFECFGFPVLQKNVAIATVPKQCTCRMRSCLPLGAAMALVCRHALRFTVRMPYIADQIATRWSDCGRIIELLKKGHCHAGLEESCDERAGQRRQQCRRQP